MLELELSTFLIVCPLVFLASFVDSVAGGGGLISLPAYVFAGLPIHAAIATNKLSASCGAFMATLRFFKNRYLDMGLAIPSVVAALVGSALGAKLVLMVPEKVTGYLLIAALVIAAYYTLRKKSELGEVVKDMSRKRAMVLASAVSFVVGGYDGFYGPGTGTFLILLFTGLVHMDIRTASGNAKMINLASNLGSLVVFLISGKVIVVLGLVAAVFSILGGWIGAGLVIKKGSRIVRPIILVVLTLLFIKIISENLM
jgi:uncharacterized membrane protein YfcA